MQLGEAKNSGISLDFSINCKKTLGKPAINRKNTEEIQEKYPMMGLICVEVVFLQTTTQQCHTLTNLFAISLLGIDSRRREQFRWRLLSLQFFCEGL